MPEGPLYVYMRGVFSDKTCAACKRTDHISDRTIIQIRSITRLMCSPISHPRTGIYATLLNSESFLKCLPLTHLFPSLLMDAPVDDQNLLFPLNKKKGNFCYWRCVDKSCKGRLNVSLGTSHQQIPSQSPPFSY